MDLEIDMVINIGTENRHFSLTRILIGSYEMEMRIILTALLGLYILLIS